MLCKSLSSYLLIYLRNKASKTVKVGPGRAGSGRACSLQKWILGIKIGLYFIYDNLFLKLIFKKLVRYYQTPIFEGASRCLLRSASLEINAAPLDRTSKLPK